MFGDQAPLETKSFLPPKVQVEDHLGVSEN